MPAFSTPRRDSEGQDYLLNVIYITDKCDQICDSLEQTLELRTVQNCWVRILLFIHRAGPLTFLDFHFPIKDG